MSFFNPVLNWRFGEREHDIVIHSTPLSILILVHKFLNEITGECYQKCLQNEILLDDGLSKLFHTLLMTANWASISRILNQIPIFSALSATALLVSQTNFWASSLISTQLFSKAKRGARGKAATNIVMKPNWRTKNLIVFISIFCKFDCYPFLSIPGTIPRSPQAYNLVEFETRRYHLDETGKRHHINTLIQSFQLSINYRMVLPPCLELWY